MQIIVKIVLCIFLLGIGASCREGKNVRIVPVEDFFRSPEMTSFQISPDGQYISYLKPFKNRLNIFVQTLDGKNVKRITEIDNSNVTYYSWASNDQLLFRTDRSSGAFLYSVFKDGSNFKELISDERVNLKLINTKNFYGNRVLVGLNRRDSTVFDAYSLNLRTGDLKLEEKNPGNIFQWYADENGKLRMAMASDGVNETLLFRISENDRFKPVISNNFKSRIIPVGFCGSNKNCIYALSNVNRDKLHLVKFNCNTGKEMETIFSHDEVDVSEGGYSNKRRKLIFAGYETWKKERHYIDDSSRVVYAALQKQMPNTEIVLVDQDALGTKYIVKTFTDRSPGAFYLYTTADNKLLKLSDVNSSIQEEEMCKMEPLSFKSRDGKVIHGYLTLPLNGTAKNLPVVVLPHGGPSNRNSWGFSAEVQFLANRGYAVFQINYRGSDGYGKQFWISGFKKWGTDMQNDITDGVKWLISEGVANPKKIAIYGSGFGGFSAMHGLCFQPDLYVCGASQSGYLNLFTYLKAVPPYYKPILQMYYEMVGNPEKDMDYLRAVSPVFHADKIKAPVLIAQDAKDPRVKVNETNQFVKELKKRQIPVTYIVKEKERYTLRNPENRIDFYRQLEDFLEKNLK
ncbi:S9 family peptidase [Pedobacter sp. SYSU D00535]|uniref:S9 family peptidase n=1 Tax=Pedobacter sp. SYSU D00535 TaxID=2810308 RepID=UPI001A9747A6|nr:S9 family peptidase [Pedobacter sp. SYSU D00535]